MIAVPQEHLELLTRRKGLYINGEWHARGSEADFNHVSPLNGQPQAAVPMAGAAEVDAAVRAARAAYPAWRRMSPARRAQLLHRLADLFEQHIPQFVLITALECGFPISINEQLYRVGALDWMRYYAGYCDKLDGTVYPNYPTGGLAYTSPEPYGVVGCILTWNQPLASSTMKVIPALAAGNTVVVKTPEFAPFAMMLFGELCEQAGIPPGVVNILSGGPAAGAALVAHRGIDKLSFTGGIPTARKIVASTAENLVPTVLELGGKGANLIFEDADLDAALPESSFMGACALSGQGCLLPTRMIVQDTIYDRVVEHVQQIIGAIPVGNPLEPTNMVGSVINETACNRIMGIIDRARSENAGRLVVGGERLGGELANGWFIQPTVFADVAHESFLSQQEIFGPVLSILKFSTEEQGIQMANGTEYGLSAFVWTRDITRAVRLASELEAGNVYINGFNGIGPTLPFGGIKQSGHGKEGGREGIYEFIREKSVFIGSRETLA
jgi:aldehyde dehydrogenase (NAD+)